MALTREDWDALTEEERAARQDEKPEGDTGKKTPTIEELTQKVNDLSSALTNEQEAKGGIYADLKRERELRQALQNTSDELKRQLAERNDDPLAGKAEDDYLTVAEAKKILVSAQKAAKSSSDIEAQNEAVQRSQENYTADEERMQEAATKPSEDYPIPYKDAIKEFGEMAKKNPAFWTTVHQESLRRNGKPAEVAYKIALTSKNFISKIKAGARDDLIKQLENEGKLPKKLPAGGSPKTPLDAGTLSEEQLINLSDEQLTDLLKKTG